MSGGLIKGNWLRMFSVRMASDETALFKQIPVTVINLSCIAMSMAIDCS